MSGVWPPAEPLFCACESSRGVVVTDRGQWGDTNSASRGGKDLSRALRVDLGTSAGFGRLGMAWGGARDLVCSASNPNFASMSPRRFPASPIMFFFVSAGGASFSQRQSPLERDWGPSWQSTATDADTAERTPPPFFSPPQPPPPPTNGGPVPELPLRVVGHRHTPTRSPSPPLSPSNPMVTCLVKSN